MIHRNHYRTMCILPIENYDKGLGWVRWQQPIPIKENAVKEPSAQD